MKHKKQVSVLLACLMLGVGLMDVASAASLIDTAGSTAIDSGFTDIQDTVKDVLSITWKYFLGIIGLMCAPGLVSRMVHSATGKK
jgi:hypothetical protein